MPTPADCISMAASLLNDNARAVYTDQAALPYFNMALERLLQELEQNNVGITNVTSAVVNIPAGITIAPQLPADLIELQQVWESPEGTDNWSPMVRKDYIPHYMEGVSTNKFIIYVWNQQQLQVPPSTSNNDLKLDYVGSIVNMPILIDQVNTNIAIINSKAYLGYMTAALCSQFVSENPTRYEALMGLSSDALGTMLGINNKGRQAIVTRHRPFRSSLKARGRSW